MLVDENMHSFAFPFVDFLKNHFDYAKFGLKLLPCPYSSSPGAII